MPEQGLVTGVSGNMLSVQMAPLSTCGSCTACDARKRSELTIEIENTCHAAPGDLVLVEMEQSILAGSLIFYGIPLLAFTVGILLGTWAAPRFVSPSWQEPATAMLAILFLLLSYGGIRLAGPLIKRHIRFPTVAEILPRDETEHI